MFGGATICQAHKKHTKWLKSVAKCYTFADESRRKPLQGSTRNMANALYDLAKEALLSGSINLASNDIRCVLVRKGVTGSSTVYAPNLVTDRFLSSVPAGSRVATSGALASKTVALGVFDAANVLFPAVAAGAAVNSIVIYKWVSADGDSPLIAYMDTAEGLPFTPVDEDLTLAWASGGIFSL